MPSFDSKLISVITIVYNNVQSVEKTILSVIKNKTDFIEYIVIDGGSMDGTLDILQKYRSYIDVMVSEKDNGISDAFNKGIVRATGKWLLFLNSGDIFTDTIVIGKVYDTLKKNNGKMVCFYNVMLSNGAHTMPTQSMIDQGKDMIVALAEIPHQGAFIQKAAFEKYGLFNTFFSLRMDYEFFARMRAETDTMEHINEVLAIYEFGGRSNQRSNFELFLQETISIKLKYRMKLTLGELARFFYLTLRRFLMGAN